MQMTNECICSKSVVPLTISADIENRSLNVNNSCKEMNLQTLTTAVTIHNMYTTVSITKKRDNRGLNHVFYLCN